MEVKVNIPFEELVAIVRQLPPEQKDLLKKELVQEAQATAQRSRLTEMLLRGPVFTEEQIKAIEETRKEINQWRTGS
jgi:hypothetical protein